MGDNINIPAPPPGFNPIQSPSDMHQDIPAPPPGFTPLEASSNPNDNLPASSGNFDKPTALQPSDIGNIAVGAGKGLLKTVAGVGELAKSGGVPVPESILQSAEKASEPQGFAQGAGSAIESGAEFGAGEAGLEGITKLAKIGKYAPEIIQLMEDYPKASRIILGTLKGGAVGAAQGAVKGAAGKEGAVAGAEGGAIGGASGGAIGETLATSLPTVAKLLGVGGQDFESAMTKAGRPQVPEYNWKQSLQTAKPLIVDNINPKSIKNIDSFVDQIENVQDNLWNEVKGEIGTHGQGVFSAHDVANKIRAEITPELKEFFPKEAADMEDFAKKFDKNMTIEGAHNAIELFNAKLKSYYKMSPEVRAAIGKTDGDISALENAADNLRDKMFDEIEARGGMDAETLRLKRQQYGALNDVARVFTKRIPVAERQETLSLAQKIALIEGLAQIGHAVGRGSVAEGAAAALPLAATTVQKMRSTPESLIRQGLSAEAEPSTLGKIASGVTRTAIASGGQQIGQGGLDKWVTVRSSNGDNYMIHPEDYAEAKKRDPGLVELNNK